MSDRLYVTAMEAGAGKAVVALGVLDLVARQVERVAVFRPVVPDGPGPDPLVDLLSTRYRLDVDPAGAYAATYSEATELVRGSDTRLLAARVLDRFARLRAAHDFVLCLGTDFLGPSPATELELNASLATHLGAPVLNVVSGHGKTPGAVASATGESRHRLERHGCRVVATIVNRAQPSVTPELVARLAADGIDAPVYVLPDLPVLSALTVDEVVTALRGRVLVGGDSGLNREVDGYLAGSGHLQTVLHLLRDGMLVFASGDRVDLAVGAAAAARSPDLPTPAGVVLTCGLVPDARSLALLEPADVPVVAVEGDTYATLHALEGLHGQIRPGSTRKIAAAVGAFAAGVDADELGARIRLSRTDVVTPLMFSSGLVGRARTDRRTIVLPEADDERVLRAAEELVHQQVADLVLLGAGEVVAARIATLGLDLGGARVIDPLTSPLRVELAASYAALRAHRGVTPEAAFDLLGDGAYFGTMMVHAGHVDGMVSGATSTTAHTIRPALEVLRADGGLVSSAFFMCLPDRVLVFGDCAVNPDPTAEQLAVIAAATADTAAAFGIEPRVALVSYSTGPSGTGVDVEKVRRAAGLLAARRPDLPLVGPIQYDAAVDPGVAAAKMPGDAVAGHATVLVFPDLNTGNTTYKAVQRSAGAVAVGPVLQGLRRPVNDLSRGCTVADIVDTVAITAIQAQRR